MSFGSDNISGDNVQSMGWLFGKTVDTIRYIASQSGEMGKPTTPTLNSMYGLIRLAECIINPKLKKEDYEKIKIYKKKLNKSNSLKFGSQANVREAFDLMLDWLEILVNRAYMEDMIKDDRKLIAED